MAVSEADTTLASHRVYIDDDGTIYDVSLNQTNVNGNNNKFYRIQILESKLGGDFQIWTRWGRVGERGEFSVAHLNKLDSFRNSYQETKAKAN
jgi:poly [ADP-ribose] polymerase